MGRRSPPPNAAGAHFLRSRSAAHLVRLAAPGPGDIVLDLGAGLGALTGPLAAAGARVVAIERHEGYVRRLRHRFAEASLVTVVAGDLLAVPLPRRDFHVVANIPFSTTAALLRRLLDPPGSHLISAHLVVELGAARRLAARSRTTGGAWWGARFDLRRGPRLPRGAFAPPPTVDAEILTIFRVPLSRHEEAALRDLLRLAGREPHRSLRALAGGPAGRQAASRARSRPEPTRGHRGRRRLARPRPSPALVRPRPRCPLSHPLYLNSIC